MTIEIKPIHPGVVADNTSDPDALTKTQYNEGHKATGAANTIFGFNASGQEVEYSLGTNLSFNGNSIDASGGGGGGLSTEEVQDVVGTLVQDSSTIDATYNDAGAIESLAVIDNTSTQKVIVAEAGTTIGTRSKINFIEGSNVTITTADNSGADRVDVTIASAAGSGSTTANTFYVDYRKADNTGDGSTPATARKTISSLVGTIEDGDIVWILGGKESRYREDTVAFGNEVHVLAHGAGLATIDFSKQVLNSGFAATSGYANVYQINVDYSALFPVTHPTGLAEIYSQQFFQLFEGAPGDDYRFTYVNGRFDYVVAWISSGLSKADSLAYVRDNPGTFYVRKSDDTAVPDTMTGTGTIFTFYVHVPGSGNPITNGKEYSVSSSYGDGWKQRNGGSCSGLWFTRSGHRNGVQFDGVRCNNLKLDNYAVHGCFHNNCVIEDSESHAHYRGGACFHAYRDPPTSPDDGLIYRRCRTTGGAWGFYGHSFGVPSQKYVIVDDCVSDHSIIAVSGDTEDGFLVRRGRFTDIRMVTAAAGGTYEDCFWEVTPGGTELYNIPVFSESGKFNNCIIQGGSKGGRCTEVASPKTVDFTDCTVTVQDDQDLGTASFVTLVRSTWTGAAKYIKTASASYVTSILDHNGDCPTNAQIQDCYGHKRHLSVARTPSGNMTATTVKIWPKDIDVQCRPDYASLVTGHSEDDYGRPTVGLYGTAADRALLKVGTPVWLFQDGQRQWDMGIFFVMSVSGNSVTLDRDIKYPFPIPAGYIYQAEGDPARAIVGDWTDQKPTPTFQVRLPQAPADKSTVTLTLSGGTTFSPSNYGGFGSKKMDDEYGHSSDRTFPPVVTGEDTGTATLVMTINVVDLLPSWIIGPDGTRRLTGYLRDLGIGGNL